MKLAFNKAIHVALLNIIQQFFDGNIASGSLNTKARDDRYPHI